MNDKAVRSMKTTCSMKAERLNPHNTPDNPWNEQGTAAGVRRRCIAVSQSPAELKKRKRGAEDNRSAMQGTNLGKRRSANKLGLKRERVKGADKSVRKASEATPPKP